MRKAVCRGCGATFNVKDTAKPVGQGEHNGVTFDLYLHGGNCMGVGRLIED